MLKSLEKPLSLQTYNGLQGRMFLDKEEKDEFRRLKNGYQGEKIFESELVQGRKTDAAIFDLRLVVKGSEVQFDLLLLLQNRILHFEIKHFKGDYYFEHDKFHLMNQQEIDNPLHQLSRARLRLEKFLQINNCHIPITSYVVFTHPNFFMYKTPMDKPLIFPGQITQFVKKIAAKNGGLNSKNERIGRHLLANHLKKSRYTKLPEYNFEDLAKGLFCPKCRGKLIRSTHKSLVCSKCHFKERLTENLFTMVKEYSVLFPNRLVTVNDIYEWVGGQSSKDTIRQILRGKMIYHSHGAYSHYTWK